MVARSKRIIKDPDSILDYQFDWSEWLGQISAETGVTDELDVGNIQFVGSGIDVVNTTFTSTTATAWVSGGTVGQVATLTCTVNTMAGRREDKTIDLYIRQK